MKLRIRINGLLTFLFIFIVLTFSKVTLRAFTDQFVDEMYDIIGLSLILFGSLFRISARGYKSEYSKMGHALMVDGPYSVIRHPMYFGSFLLGTGVCFMLWKLWVFIVFLVLFFIVYIPQIIKEDKKLSKVFGDRFTVYRNNVPFFFPKIATVLKRDVAPCLPIRWLWIKNEWKTVIPTFIFIAVVETWEDVRLFGLVNFLKEGALFLGLFSSFALLIILLRSK